MGAIGRKLSDISLVSDKIISDKIISDILD
jgi:hypothetical protein